MNRWISTALLGSAVWLVGSTGFAQEGAGDAGPDVEQEGGTVTATLTLDDVLAAARRSGPASQIAAAKIVEAEGLRPGASFYPRRNPTIEAGAGIYLEGEDDPVPSVTVGFSQPLDLGGGVSARLAGVDATVERMTAEAEGAAQKNQRAAGAAYLRALWAEARVALMSDVVKIAERAAVATDKRIIAGDATSTEQSVAKATLARAKAARKGAEAERDAAQGELKALLGLGFETRLVLQGTLATYTALDVTGLLDKSKNHPDVKALAAQLREAEADLELADAMAFPELTLGIVYELEQPQVHRILGTFALTLPFADRAQGLTAQASAKKTRVEIEEKLRKAQVTTEVRAAIEVYARRIEAVEALEEGGVAGYTEALLLLGKGFEAGETSLSELIAIRRELTDAQLDYVDRQLEAALASLDARAAAGALP